MDYIDYEDGDDELDDTEGVYENFVNDDLAETRFIEIFDDFRYRPGVIVTDLDTSGEHSSRCYDIDSLEVLINTLEECREVLLEMSSEDDCD
jgi:hypothetical protein